MEKIWYEDPKHFISLSTYDKFIPLEGMSFEAQLNSILRFSIYFSIIVFIFKRNINIFIIPLFMAIFTYMFYIYDKSKKDKEKFMLEEQNLKLNKRDGTVCVKPTKNNPFMNVMMTDYKDNPDRPKACDITRANIKKLSDDNFNEKLYRDVDDIFHKNASDRQFYTTSSTTIPNDAVGFAEWCYGTGQTCKEGSGDKCLSNTYRHIKM